MTTGDVLQGLGIFLGGGTLATLLGFARKSKRDVREDTLNWHTELMKEQRDWRETLRREISVQDAKILGLQETVAELRAENAGLRARVAELEAYNEDLKRDNEELEARVKELERDLKKHEAAAEAVGL